ncbi:nuclear transport factor 2 family protein [Streptomyces sp. NPDC050263]|uniref:nuclear transport factor 2 family protein n=1 Tax=Streptomyces sp. NPDC050263 TaxID=3155037 RepID=UPI0034289655
MSVEEELTELRSELRYVRDRLAVLDCVMNHARGHDRHDEELMASAYHQDGTDEHGPVVKSGPLYGAYANEAHACVFADHLHNITTHTCEINGDVAHCESYVIGAMRARDGKDVHLIGGRYLDRLERRNGQWRIALRRCTVEWTSRGDTALLTSGAFTGFIQGSWDREDPSYARPLSLAETPVQRW